MLARETFVDMENRRVVWSDGSEPEPDLKVLVLHYLLGVRGPAAPGWRSFRESQGGPLYYSVFQSRALAPLISAFGRDPAGMAVAAGRLGGIRVERGDASFDFRFFPHLSVNVTVWAGDDEVPPSANILFDSSAIDYMGAEDLAHIAEELVAMLVQAVRGPPTPSRSSPRTP